MAAEPAEAHAFRQLQRQRRGALDSKQIREHRQCTAGTSQARRLIVVAAEPDHDQVLIIKAGKPGIACVIGGAGFAGDVQLRKACRQRLARAVAYRRLQGPAGQECRTGVDGFAIRCGAAQQRVAVAHGTDRCWPPARATVGDAGIQRAHFDR